MIRDIDRLYATEQLKKIKRSPDAHKYSAGHILVIAGSYMMAGAAIMAVRAAYRSGAGLVSVCIPERLSDIMQISIPEAICISRKEMVEKIRSNTFFEYLDLPDKAYDEKKDSDECFERHDEACTCHEEKSGLLNRPHDSRESILGKYDAVVFGPGLRVSDEGHVILKYILDHYAGKLLIDADGLNIIAHYEMTECVKKSSAQIVLTPHAGEAKRLLRAADHSDHKSYTDTNDAGSHAAIGDAFVDVETGSHSSDNKICCETGKYSENSDPAREETASFLSEKYGCTVVLKGPGTLVFKLKDNGTGMRNTTGNPGMACAGSGDVLAGMIGALMGQGLSAFDASCLGVYLHGLSGDMASEEYGEHSMTATDIIDFLTKIKF